MGNRGVSRDRQREQVPILALPQGTLFIYVTQVKIPNNTAEKAKMNTK